MWWLAHGEHEVPAGADWLSPREQAILAAIRYTKRRVEFLTRRWTAKRAVAMVLGRDLAPAALARVEIAHHPSGAPFVEVDGRRRRSTCRSATAPDGRSAWSARPAGRVARSASTSNSWSRAATRSSTTSSPPRKAPTCAACPPATARDEAANLIWSAKEAALKVLKVGLRADTREVDGRHRARSAAPDGWTPLTVTGRDGSTFPGWWRRDGVFLLTIAGTAAVDRRPCASTAAAISLPRCRCTPGWRARVA